MWRYRKVFFRGGPLVVSEARLHACCNVHVPNLEPFTSSHRIWYQTRAKRAPQHHWFDDDIDGISPQNCADLMILPKQLKSPTTSTPVRGHTPLAPTSSNIRRTPAWLPSPLYHEYIHLSRDHELCFHIKIALPQVYDPSPLLILSTSQSTERHPVSFHHERRQ